VTEYHRSATSPAAAAAYKHFGEAKILPQASFARRGSEMERAPTKTEILWEKAIEAMKLVIPEQEGKDNW